MRFYCFSSFDKESRIPPPLACQWVVPGGWGGLFEDNAIPSVEV